MLKKEVLAAINKQINQEFCNAQSYLAVACYFENQVLKGLAAWFRKQFKEEQMHAFKLLDYALDCRAEVELGTIAPAKTSFSSTVETMKFSYDAERNNTANIHALYALAGKHGDVATQQMLQWFITEQVEEEKWTDEYLTIAEKIGSSVGSLYMFDHRVGKATEKE